MPVPFDRALIFPLLFPYRTSVPRASLPLGTIALIVATLGGFLAVLGMGEGLLARAALQNGGVIYQYLSYAFVHEASPFGLLHMAVSLYLLWLFGSALESRAGALGVVVLYLVSAAAGGFAHAALPHAPGPLVGASGAVFGLMGAFAVMQPSATLRCFFAVLLVVFPLRPRQLEFSALYFIALYWLLLGAAQLVASVLGFDPAQDSISQSAHLGGFLAGVGLGLVRFGLSGFNVEIGGTAERKLERRLARAVAGEAPRPGESTNPGSLSDSTNGLGISKNMLHVHENLLMGDKQRAREEFAKVVPFDTRACLPPDAQLELARALEELGDEELAIEAYERLLRIWPTHDAALTGRLELARLVTRLGVRLMDAQRLLHEFLAARPSPDQEREAYRLLRQGEGRIAIQVNPESTIFQTLAQPPAQESPGGASGAVFGDPNDTNNAFNIPVTPHLAHSSPHPEHRHYGPPPLASAASAPVEDSGFSAPLQVFVPGIVEPQRMEQDAVSLEGRPVLPTEPAPATPVTPLAVASASPPVSPVPAEAVAQLVPEEVLEQPEPTARLQVEERPSELSERLYADGPSENDYTQGLADSGHNRRVAQELTGDFAVARAICTHFALILPPAAAIDVRSIVHVLAPEFGMRKNAAHHALLRRRGVLADDLGFEQATQLARRFAEAGQSVSIVARGARWLFRPPRDLMALRIVADHAEGSLEDGNLIRFAWSEVVCLGAGLVHLSPDAPPRALLDLFVAGSGHHLRVWENSFLFEPGVPAAHRFLDLAHKLADRVPQAILTRAVQSWLNHELPRPDADFASLIEYENALDWHLMAYFHPRLEVTAQSA